MGAEKKMGLGVEVVDLELAARPGYDIAGASARLVPKGRHVVATGVNPWLQEPTNRKAPNGAT